MIAKGNFHGDGQKLAAYLVKGHPGEEAELVEMRGFRSNDLREAFRDIEIEARGTKAESAFFHCYTRLSPGETLTDAQWRQVADREEQRLGFTGQPRAVSFHIDQESGEKHMHIVWSRIARAEDGKLYAIDPGLYKNKLMGVCREYEMKFALREVSSERAADQKTRYADRNEFEESRRLDTDLKSIRNTIHDCFQHSDNGKAFNSALGAQGYVLAKGDRRDGYLVIDTAGGHHPLNKRLTGLTLADIRSRFSDLDAGILPSVDQAKAMQEQHRQAVAEAQQTQREGPGKEATLTAGRARTQQPAFEPNRTAAARGQYENLSAEATKRARPLGQTAGEIRMAWRITQTGGQFAEEIERRGLHLVHVTPEEAYASERARDFARAVGRQNRALREGFAVVDRRGGVTRIDQRATGDQWEEIQKRLGGIERDKLMKVAEARADMREKNQAEFRARREAEAAQARRNAEINETAGDIRLAWRLTQGRQVDFQEALETRGMRLARVSTEEAYASERRAALAQAAGRYAPVYRDGEIVVMVNRFGNICRLDERTTGDLRPEIDGRLADFDTSKLFSIAETKNAINETQRAEWIAGKRAGEIRLAWQLSRTDAELHEALGARGFKFGRVTAEEAYAGERRAAFAQEVGLRPPVFRDNEIVVVDRFGSAFRIDERTTGKSRDEIDKRLAGIDAGNLLGIAATAAAIKQQRRDAWIAEQEKHRPASAIENRIADCADQARRLGATIVRDRETGRDMSRVEALADRLKPAEQRHGESVTITDGKAAFAALLADKGIAIVRISDQDVKALDALRHDEQLDRLASETNSEARRQHRFAKLKTGDLAAVMRYGDVQRLNLEKTGDARQYLAETLPDMTTARGAFETEHAATETLWQQHRATVAAEQQQRTEAREERAATASTVRTARQSAAGIATAAWSTISTAGRKGGRMFDTLAKTTVGVFSSLAPFAMAAPKLTPEQAQRAQQVREEEHKKAAWVASAEQQEARFLELQDQMLKRDGERARQRRESGINEDIDRGRDR